MRLQILAQLAGMEKLIVSDAMTSSNLGHSTLCV
jgi:hypothetical protein